MQTEKEYTAGREVLGLRCESVGEYSLPDYNGDVRKVLFIRPKAFPSGTFVGDGVLEISGIIEYEVVYLDSDNVLTHAQFSTDYDAALKVNAESYVDSDVVTEISSYSVRLTGPRKFSAKAILDSSVAINESRHITVEGDAFMEYEPEYVGESVKVLSMAFATADSREIEEEIVSIDGAIADEVVVLLCDAHAETGACDVSEVGLNVKGDVIIDMLYVNGDADPIRVNRVISYSEDVSLADASDFENVSAILEIGSLKSSIIPTEDGVKLCVAVKVTPRVRAKRNTLVNLVSDAFLKERGTDNEYADFNYTEHVCTETKEERRELKYPLAELDTDGVSDILYSSATPRIEGYDVTRDGVSIYGEVKVSAVAIQENDEGARTYAPIKFSVPYEQNVNIDYQITDNMHINCHSNVTNLSLNLDANHLGVALTLCTSVGVLADKKRRHLAASYITDEEYTLDDSIVTVYYPDASEKLFDIARKFHTSTRSIAECNRLTEAVFSSSQDTLCALGVSKLIIK